MPLKILIIDDDDIVTDLLSRMCVKQEHHVSVINYSPDITNYLDEHFDLIFLDLNMPFMDGIEVMRLLEKSQLTTPLVLMSGYDESVLLTAIDLANSQNLFAIDKLTKPFQLENVLEVLNKVVYQSNYPTQRKSSNKLLSQAYIEKLIKLRNVVVFYQPQVDLRTNLIIGVEALCRLQDENGKLIFPDSFIPVIERTNLMHDLTKTVCEVAAKDFSKLKAINPELTLSLNISSQDLDYLTLPDELYQLFVKQKILSKSVIIEVTETTLMNDVKRGLDVLARLRLKGFKISIDDFGQGTATIGNVKNFPANEIKIDREFIAGIENSEKSEVIVAQTIKLAHSLNMIVVAEGVEKKSIEQRLKRHNCDIVQGYFYSKPVSFNDLKTLIQNQYQSPTENSYFLPVNA